MDVTVSHQRNNPGVSSFTYACHAEPIRFAQGKLGEESRGPAREILRCTQDDTI